MGPIDRAGGHIRLSFSAATTERCFKASSRHRQSRHPEAEGVDAVVDLYPLLADENMAIQTRYRRPKRADGVQDWMHFNDDGQHLMAQKVCEAMNRPACQLSFNFF
jgi:hypothetical protein